MEDLRSRFHKMPLLRAEYDFYQRKRTEIIQFIKNSLGENDLMLELLQSNQPYVFKGVKR